MDEAIVPIEVTEGDHYYNIVIDNDGEWQLVKRDE